jgi:hypothetical protein
VSVHFFAEKKELTPFFERSIRRLVVHSAWDGKAAQSSLNSLRFAADPNTKTGKILFSSPDACQPWGTDCI